MSTKQNPGAGQAAGAQEKLESTTMVARCGRCGQRITAPESLATGLGRDCRRHLARVDRVRTAVSADLRALAELVEAGPLLVATLARVALVDLDEALAGLGVGR